MKRLRYKNKEEPSVSIGDLPHGFTPTHVYTYGIKNGKVKCYKKKLTKAEIKRLTNEREESQKTS